MQLRHVAACALVALAGCSLDTGSPNNGLTGSLLIVNAAKNAGDIQIYLDGNLAGNVPLGVVGIANIGGQHTLEVRRGNGDPGFSAQVALAGSQTITLVAIDSAGVLRPSVISDTGAVVPPGASKLRVAHFASSAGPIDIWRTQPDFQTPSRVMFPFAYQDESAYLQSTPGDWRILVSDTVPQATPGAPMPDTLAMSDLITVPTGSSVTVVLVDKLPTGIQFVLLVP